MVRFDLGPLLQGQSRIHKLKSVYISLIIGPRGLHVKPSYRKSWAGNLDVIRFDLGSFLRGQTRIAKSESDKSLFLDPRDL